MRKRVLTTLLLVLLSCTMLTGCFKEVAGEASTPSDFQVDVKENNAEPSVEGTADNNGTATSESVAEVESEVEAEPTPEPTVEPSKPTEEIKTESADEATKTTEAEATEVAEAPTKTGYEMIADRGWEIDKIEADIDNPRTFTVNWYDLDSVENYFDESLNVYKKHFPEGIENGLGETPQNVQIKEYFYGDADDEYYYFESDYIKSEDTKYVMLTNWTTDCYMDNFMAFGTCFIDGNSGNAFHTSNMYSDVLAYEGAEDAWLKTPVTIEHNGQEYEILVSGYNYKKDTDGDGAYEEGEVCGTCVELFNVPVDYYDYVFGCFGACCDGTLQDDEPLDRVATTAEEFENIVEVSTDKCGIQLFQLAPQQ